MTLRVTRHAGDLAQLEADWRRLHAGQRGATPFTGYDWAAAWWRHYGTELESFVLVVRDGARVVGLAALARRRRGPLRLLEALGTPPGDQWDVLAEPELRAAVCVAVAEALAGNRRTWDAWVLRLTPPASPLPHALVKAGIAGEQVEPLPDPRIELPDDFDAYLKTLSSSRRSNLRKHLRRLDEGVVELEQVTDPETFPALLGRWQDLRRAQWDDAEREINPDHLSPRFAAFVLDVTRALVPTGNALLWRFTHEGREVGIYVNWADADAFHWYLGGFDPAVAQLGLGKIAIGHGIRTSVQAGRSAFDFGYGAEPYKYWYGAQDRQLAASVPVTSALRGSVMRAGVRGALAVRARRARVSADG